MLSLIWSCLVLSSPLLFPVDAGAPSPSAMAYGEDLQAVTAQVFTITRASMNGGGEITGGSFKIISTIGQPVVGRSVGGDFVVKAGFLTRSLMPLFSDGFESGNTSRWSLTVNGH